MPLTVDVVVPTFGKWPLTESCLAHLAAQDRPHRVIVVDDAGPDDTVERLRRDYRSVQVIALETNSGFAAACNRGIAAGSGDVVILLNNDVDADPRLISELVEALESDPRLGSCAAVLTRPDGKLDSAGLSADVTMAGFVRLAGRPIDDLHAPTTSLLGPYGAVAAFRRSALAKVGLLDEGIFMYGEELDLALRLSAAGWETRLVEGARGVHVGGATSGRGTATQRQRAGFGRGYLLRAYGVLRGRFGPRALATEIVVCVGDAILSRDLASLKGRIAGWRAGRTTFRRVSVVPGIDRSIGFFASLRLRVGSRT